VKPGLAVGAAAALAIAWWLGSPLFLKTYADEALPAPAAPGSTAAPVAARTLKAGKLQYVDPTHHGTGEVRVVETGDARILRFESVAISNAPDIQIYLSTDVGGRYVPANTTHLGALKATNGSFNYDVPAGLDPGRIRSVVVWYRAFNMLVTWADLT